MHCPRHQRGEFRQSRKRGTHKRGFPLFVAYGNMMHSLRERDAMAKPSRCVTIGDAMCFATGKT